MENKIIQGLFKSREFFETCESLKIKKGLTDPCQVIYDEIISYYDKDKEAKLVDVDLISEQIFGKFPKQKSVFEHLINQIKVLDVSIPNLVGSLGEFKKEELARELSSALLGIGRDNIPDLIEQYLTVEEATNMVLDNEDAQKGRDVASLFEKLDSANRIRLWPESSRIYWRSS